MSLVLLVSFTIPIYMKQVFGCSFPKELLKKLDNLRADVPRSTYLQRLVEKELLRKR